MCGGTVSVRPVPAALKGLSPRVRGNLQNDERITRKIGSIPACAGEPLRRHRLER